jgi:TonB-linked SusC/RagA family outer membrane protein
MRNKTSDSKRYRIGKDSFFGILLCIILFGPMTYISAAENSTASLSTSQQDDEMPISGLVTDINDEPLIGATIFVKGTKKGTVTDVDGRFRMSVRSGQTLVISYVSMHPKEVTVKAGQKEVVVQLEANTELLDEVMVTGYQTLSRERSTGAFSKVTADKLEIKRMDNLSSILEGQIAGYVDGQIRGVTTMNAVANPMVVIDGFPVENTTLDRIGRTEESMPDLNPEDIESITVLKDAAAASIYGARAANGVIVITTKKAEEGKTEVNFSSTFTVHPYSFYKKNFTDAADVIAMEREWAASALNTPEAAETQAADLRENGAYPSLGVNTLLDMYTGKISMSEGNETLDRLAALGYQYYDQAEKYGKRNPFYQQHNLRVAKTTGRNSFNFSTTYWNNDYEDVNHDDWKLGVNITNSLNLTKWLKFDVGVYLKYGREHNQAYNLLAPGFSFMPYDPLVNADGTYFVAPSQIDKERRDMIQQYGLYSEDLVPMDELNYALSKNKTFETRAFAKLNFDITSWLNYNVMFQYETSNSDYESLNEKESNYMRTRINDFTSKAAYGNGLEYNLPDGNSFYTLNNKKRSYNFRQQLNFDKTFDNIHNVVWILGQEIRHSLINFDENTVYGYDPSLMTWQNFNVRDLAYFSGLLGAAQLDQNSIASSRELLNRFVSFYSNASYTYDDRYVVSGSIRWDRSNLWGTNSKYQNKPLWSVGGSWNIYKEDFFNVPWINMLKLRTSYGIGGNIGRNTAPYLIAAYYPSNLVDGMAGAVQTPPNKDIRWEKTTTVNVGVDFSLFRNRLSGSIEYYNKNSVDLLAAINGSPTQGFGYTPLMTNNGKMVNHGVEITLNGLVMRNKDFSWNASLLYSFNRNKVKKISVEPSLWNSRVTLPTSYPMVDKPLYSIFAYKWAGLNEKGDPQVYDADGNITDGPTRDYHALAYCGTTIPVHSATLTNVLRYKDFEFSAMFILNAGHKLRASNIPSINMANGRIVPTAKDIVNRWKEPGSMTDVPRLLFSNDTENFNTHRTELYRYSDLFVYNASNIRVRNLSLAYRVPTQWCKKVFLSSARLQFNVENVATIAFDSKAHYDLGGKIKPNYVWGLYLNF